MRTSFQLKETPWPHEIYLTNADAEEAYRMGEAPDYCVGIGSLPRRISCGFYAVELTFLEWLDQYHIKIA